MILTGILFVLAFSDLIVGVSNDAVNFLNSAIGSKAASFNTIALFAMAGVLAGSVFSSGMMEVARKGIFHPQFFAFSEVMIIFLGVMLADIILLDLFNTFGIPTSTTVSVVFELLGAAVGMALIKVYHDPNHLSFGEYINSARALAIISAILFSVVVALLAGAIIQYFVRLVFTFDYEKNFRRFGAIWAGLAISGIMFFILIKGAKNATFMDKATKQAIHDNWLLILSTTFVAGTILFLILQRLKVNILRIVVLIGTFALAMAFAGNDLVNFIGVPMAAYNAYHFFVESGATSPDTFMMKDLAHKVPANTWMLVLSGVVMALTLKYSRKARSVTETEVNLGRQDEEGYERFGSTIFARMLVQNVINAHKRVTAILPDSFNEAVARRFKPKKWQPKEGAEDQQPPHFDMLRASVNIFVAAILISIGTTLKLPLSTTYVTFMVAMGSSLSDRAWGRESAVYRVSGVLAVIGSWFFTALFGFTMAFILVNIMYFGGKLVVFALLAVVAFILYQTHFLHKKREEKKSRLLREAQGIGKLSADKLVAKSADEVLRFLSAYQNLISRTLSNLASENRRGLRTTYSDFLDINALAKEKKEKVNKVIDKLTDDSLESGYYYVQVMDYLRELSNSTRHFIEPALKHVENSHKPLIPEQNESLNEVMQSLREFVNTALETVENRQSLETLNDKKKELLKTIKKARKLQIKRIKANQVGTRNSMLFFALLTELKNFALFGYSFVKAQQRLADSAKGILVDDTAE